jgi:uncharacterized protein YfbU (UPF0304 family)
LKQQEWQEWILEELDAARTAAMAAIHDAGHMESYDEVDVEHGHVEEEEEEHVEEIVEEYGFEDWSEQEKLTFFADLFDRAAFVEAFGHRGN